jgi:hypothetical protein
MARFFIDARYSRSSSRCSCCWSGRCRSRGCRSQSSPIALPTVQVSSNYLGASSDVVEESVTVPLDQQINGVTDMLYINAVSGDDGSAGTRLSPSRWSAIPTWRRRGAEPGLPGQAQLPQEVIAQGVTVRKQSPDVLMYFAVHSPDDTYDRLFIVNYAYVYIVDQLKRAKGVGECECSARSSACGCGCARSDGEPQDHGRRRRARDSRAERTGAAGQIGHRRPRRPELPVLAAVRGRLVDASEFATSSSAQAGRFLRSRSATSAASSWRARLQLHRQLDGHPSP